MAKVTTIEIDGTKLAEIFKKRGLKMQDVSRDCGFDGSYFSHKIYPNEYEVAKLEPEVVQAELLPIGFTGGTEFTISDDTAKKLHTIIYSAVYEAVKMALNE